MLIENVIKRIQITSAERAKYYCDKDNWVVINVAEPDEVPNSTINIPLLSKQDWLSWDKPISISKIRLDAVASVINDIIVNTNININCTMGIERSPLVVYWYLHKYHNLSLLDSFDIVKKIRPEAENRIAWIKYDNYEEWQEHNKKVYS